MARPSRRSGLLVALALAALLGVGAGTLAWAAESDPPTVTFAPLGACSSRPDVTGLEVPQATPVLLVNDTGSDATVMVGSVPALDDPVPDGGGVLLTLAPGQHEVRMARGCGNAQPVTVLVTSPAPGSPSPPTSASPAPAGTSGSQPDGVGPGSGPSTGPLPGGSPAVVPLATTVVVGTPGSTSLGGYDGPAVVMAARVDPTGAGNPKAVRLLAAIATICVLGVTAAIIRSIVRLSP
jgi:hypothetical protein